MSEDRDLERRLDEAFASTRPRRGFEDELWARLAPRRERWWRRFPDRLPLPLPALGTMAALLLVAFVFVVAHPFAGHPAGSSPTSFAPAQGTGRSGGAADQSAVAPRSADVPPPGPLTIPPEGGAPSNGGYTAYYGPANVTLAAPLPALPAVVPVYRYATPDAAAGDAFARGLNAAPAAAGTSAGTYAGSGFVLKLLPAQAGREPLFALTPVAPAAAPEAFLAQLGLLPGWPSQKAADPAGGHLLYRRLFDVPGFGQAVQVDQKGEPAGLDLLLDSRGAVVAVVGPQPLQVDVQWKPVRAAADVAAEATAGGRPDAPAVALNKVSVVYVAVPAGDHGFFVPAYLLSGTFELQGHKLEKRLLVGAV